MPELAMAAMALAAAATLAWSYGSLPSTTWALILPMFHDMN